MCGLSKRLISDLKNTALERPEGKRCGKRDLCGIKVPFQPSGLMSNAARLVMSRTPWAEMLSHRDPNCTSRIVAAVAWRHSPFRVTILIIPPPHSDWALHCILTASGTPASSGYVFPCLTRTAHCHRDPGLETWGFPLFF